jgi:hypothetical protein
VAGFNFYEFQHPHEKEGGIKQHLTDISTFIRTLKISHSQP